MSQDFPCVDQRCRPRAPRTAASVASSSEDPFHSEALPQNAQGEHEQMKLEIEMAQGKLQPKATDWSLQVSPPVLQYNLMHYPVLVRPANLSIPLKSRKSRAAWMPGGLTRPLRLVEIERERARERERESSCRLESRQSWKHYVHNESVHSPVSFSTLCMALAFLANCTRSSLPFLRANKVRVVWMPRDLTVPHARGRERQRERFISDLPARGKTQFEPNRLLNSVCPLRTSYHFAARGTLPFQ